MVDKNILLSIQNWEKDYLKTNRSKLTDQQVDILEGRELKSHEGMIFGQMYADWKKQKGFNLNDFFNSSNVIRKFCILSFSDSNNHCIYYRTDL